MNPYQAEDPHQIIKFRVQLKINLMSDMLKLIKVFSSEGMCCRMLVKYSSLIFKANTSCFWIMMLVSHGYTTYAGDNHPNSAQLIETEYSEQLDQAKFVEEISDGQLLKAIEFGSDLARIQPLVQEVKQRVNSGTPLHDLPTVEVAQSLIEQGVDCHALDADGNTALHIASRYGRPDLVQLLLDQGLDVNLKNKSGGTPLRMAIAALDSFKDNTVECIDILLKHGAQPDVTDIAGNDADITPLNMAREPSSLWFGDGSNIIKWLEQAQAEISSCPDKNEK